MVVELRAEGPGSYAGAPPLTRRQEGELDCDVCVNSHTGKVAESFILFRYKPKTKKEWGSIYKYVYGKNLQLLLVLCSVKFFFVVEKVQSNSFNAIRLVTAVSVVE